MSTLVTISSFPPLSACLLNGVHQDLIHAEVKDAVFEMGPLKAPGPDGLQALFFQYQWHIIGNSVIQFVQQCFNDPQQVTQVNETLLVLIPKIEAPERIIHYRPISLCNVIYKIVTKVLTNRLKRAMADLVSPNQCSFVPGRHSSDNIIISQEIFHSMRFLHRKNGWMAIKVDLEKAYDRVRWSFLF